MRAVLPLLLIAGWLPRASVAQAGAPTTSPSQLRFYGGVGITSGIYQSYGTFFKPGLAPTAILGLRLRPRLAVEASVQYAQHEETNNYISEPTFYNNTTQQQVHAHVTTTTRETLLAIPILVRATLTKSNTQRAHFDVLGGIAVARNRIKNDFAARNDAQTIIYSFNSDSPTTELYLCVGPSFRYSISSHIDLVADALLQRSLTHLYPYSFNASGHASLSLRYTPSMR